MCIELWFKMCITMFITIEKYSSIEFITNSIVFFDSINFNKKGSFVNEKVFLCKSNIQILDYIEQVAKEKDKSKLNCIILNPFDYSIFIRVNNILEEANLMYCFAIFITMHFILPISIGK